MIASSGNAARRRPVVGHQQLLRRWRGSLCTRTLYVGDDGTVITGRNMDWKEDMYSDLWALPAGVAREGGAGPGSIR